MDATRLPLILAALSGAMAVAAGAFGAHGASSEAAKGWLQTGGSYQLVHAVAAIGAVLLARSGSPGALWAAWLFVVGAALFSGALYGLALGGPRGLGPWRSRRPAADRRLGGAGLGALQSARA
jgi:uncharacterized membrane protein YgdD (TMEM256/DUF423 family)